ncbi:MAG TPA: phospho-N-acetylmuramoyl-pentapeptide-transferase [Algoriphagus sp.]|jgi:phospho-N-acetylmuramoyl-pentapeptide-transferase|uniref:Phospho-N-acetylmuramoyl-pentapeptide-transferase n=1 Tax=Algoriphagus ornithinivorans TaxID=226506 RepID=A0A1I5DLF2_9BACT|nr:MULTISPECIES: phospho-N-acetylmuramoyl-pentapeptide-transferase [Algoriphagus]MAL14424.1 phospho-N-acetylmuramoyl-pentapeptide-transferase [Algoriphagus sp.]QYH40971.1 phospho-N-acetylmuramoyl-pentapeptide-transferase [Algoriphagus sp. NBT04N3]SFN99996.1 Phospho-N-acetylmuramoyl-pentapeptide-transferase [Algoriphagus ornithinivorans]HAD50220.1 phospho-N-acetylmuramoyl-pentapeptide-transferase [Algoriphagus sp.]HAH36673.1 phospho-N-acetylmuramoyl-pentapeptide-transferase [Algoriphagus sp.]|tara:strand:+ start:6114 stop:7325 length:1212 start_codon:yes stop_codon:yes gene_type:complete
MLYPIFDYLDKVLDIPGAGVFRYISFRAGMAAVLSLIITITFGHKIIAWIRNKQIGETVRDLGLEGQTQKKGTPTMGGLMMIAAILIPTLLFGDLDNIYILLLLITTVWLGGIGFLDDYIKVFRKNKEGLAGRFKIIGQIGIGIIVGATLYFHEDVVIREFQNPVSIEEGIVETPAYQDIKIAKTTIPFVKNNELNYESILGFLGESMTPVLYILVVIFIITAVSNGANITDGIDGLAAGTSAIIGLTIAIFAYLSGNAIFSQYLNIMYIPNSGELVIFASAFIGACVGFLWYNAYPAQVFMGDTGSLMLGGVIAVLALTLRKELLIPIMCGIFLVENLSVMIQVSYFKYTKRKYGEGRRIFLMSPLHHHYQKKSIPEAKIVTRFWIVGILLAVITLATLKLR